MQVSTGQAVQWLENYNENGSFYKKQKALLDVVEYHIHERKRDL
ncbi:MAG: hypothetical protein ACLUTA_07910 [Blautia wexlerae]